MRLESSVDGIVSNMLFDRSRVLKLTRARKLVCPTLLNRLLLKFNHVNDSSGSNVASSKYRSKFMDKSRWRMFFVHSQLPSAKTSAILLFLTDRNCRLQRFRNDELSIWLKWLCAMSSHFSFFMSLKASRCIYKILLCFRLSSVRSCRPTKARCLTISIWLPSKNNTRR